MSSDIKNDLINWNAEQLSDDSPVYNSKDLINALNSIMPSLGSVILTTNNHVLSKQEDWDSITMNTLNMFTTLANSGLPASDFPNNSGILLVLGYTSYNIYIAISGEAVYYRLGGDDWNKLLTSETIKDLTGSVATLTTNLSKLSDQQTTLNNLFNTFKDDTTKQLDTLNNQSTSQAKMLEDINNQSKLMSRATGEEFNNLKNNLQNLVLGNRHRLTYKSVSVGLTPNAGVQPPRADFEFKHLANMGVSATFVVMLNVTDKNDSNVQMPDDTIITKAISEATVAGVPVTMLKPHIGTSFMDWLDRATYEPHDWAAFWTNWQNVMLHYAGICDANKIPILCLGCEQYNCTDVSMMQKWETLTEAIRSNYPNLKLTYAANGDEYFNEEHSQIAKYLDFMGANFYPRYTYKTVQPGNAGGISVDELARAFYTVDPSRLGTKNKRTYHEMVDFYQEKYNVQTFITETGVMPTDDGLVHLLSDNKLAKDSDPTQQTGRFETTALAMEAFFKGLAQNPNIIGFAWWSVGYPFHFFNALGDSVAEDVMQKYVKGGLV